MKRACIPMPTCLSVLPTHYEVSRSPSPQTSLKMLDLTASPDTMAPVTTRYLKPQGGGDFPRYICHRVDNSPQVFFFKAYIITPWLNHYFKIT